MRTQVAIVGGGPSGLLLGQLLARRGIESVVLERRSRAHVLGRIRAGVLEQGLVDLVAEAGVDARLRREGLVHEGVVIAHRGEGFRIDLAAHAGRPVIVYGQTELTRDLYEAREAMGGRIAFEAEVEAIEGAAGAAGARPVVRYRLDGRAHEIACDFVAGCDGFHGVSRRTIPPEIRRDFERVHPFGWLGVLSRTPPVHDELIYAGSERGFALCSMRGAGLSRYYLQCPSGTRPEAWSDAAFWDELRHRLPARWAEALATGPAIERSVAPLRSFVTEPMRWGRLLLCGDAAHIVPPTGAKGLNTAASDVRYLFEALRLFYEEGSQAGIEGYSARALARVWKVQRFSWWFTGLMHRFPDQTPIERRMQEAEIDLLRTSRPAQAAMAEGYVGLPH